MAIFPIASDKAQLTTEAVDALDNYACGILTDSLDTKARAWPTGGTVYQNGFLFTPSGQVVYVDATSSLPTGTTYHNGLPYAPTGELCISTDATVYWSNGLPFVANGALSVGNNLYGAPSFQVNLITSLIQQLGSGSPTFTRADATPCATHTDFEGVVRVVPANCARFAGARFVQNLYTGSSTLGTQGVTTKAGDHTVSFTGTGTITFTGTYTGSLVGQGASTRVGMTFTATAGTLTSTVSGSVTNGQLEYVQGQTNKNPSEYVDSAASYGAGVPGIAYFATLNGNTVSANVVTSGTGAAIKQGVVGSELLPNPGPFSSTTGWTPFNSASVSVDGSSNLVVTNGSFGGVTGNTTAITGNSYRVVINLVSSTSASVQSNILGTGNRSLTIGAINTFDVVAAGNQITLFNNSGTGGVNCTFSLVSIKPLVVSPSAPVDASGPLGYLPEGSRTNLCLQSQAFSNASWTTGATTLGAFTTAPDGTNTMQLLIAQPGSTTHQIVNTAATLTAASYTYSAYFKAGGYTKIGFRENLITGAYATFDVSNGTVLDFGAGATAATIKAIGNGVYRVTLTMTASAASYQFTTLILSPSYTTGTPAVSWVGDNVSGVYMWGYDWELGAFASTYIPTAASAVTRAADVLTFPSAGNIGATGSVYAEAIYNSGATLPTVFQTQPTTVGSFVTIGARAAGGDLGWYANGLGAFTTPSTTTVSKYAIAFSGVNFSGTVNGLAVQTSAVSDYTNTGTTGIAIGTRVGSRDVFSTIRNVRIYPTALSSAQLVALTSP